MVRALLFGAMLLLVALLTQIAGCANPNETAPKLHTLTGFTMGTSYMVKWPQRYGVVPAEVSDAVENTLQQVNQQMSTYLPDSELSRFNAAPAPYQQVVSPELAAIIQESIDLHRYTQGFFDVSIGPLVNLWGFGPDFKPDQAPADALLKQAQDQVGIGAIRVEGQTLFKAHARYVDLSAIAKGFGVDQVAAVIEGFGIQDYLVEIGGEIRSRGHKDQGKPWQIAIEKPDVQGRAAQKVLSMFDTGMATSGDYRNYFEVDGERYSHTIDPNTGRPSRHKLASVTVLDPRCARADALATAMLVMGEVKAQAFAEQNQIPAYFIVREGEGFTTVASSAFDARFATSSSTSNSTVR